jgi:hypothetical protein
MTNASLQRRVDAARGSVGAARRGVNSARAVAIGITQSDEGQRSAKYKSKALRPGIADSGNKRL